MLLGILTLGRVFLDQVIDTSELSIVLGSGLRFFYVFLILTGFNEKVGFWILYSPWQERVNQRRFLFISKSAKPKLAFKIQPEGIELSFTVLNERVIGSTVNGDNFHVFEG